jgi:hypothetical protein
VSAGLALLLLASVAQPAPERGTRVAVEVFRVGLAAGSEGLVFSRSEGPLENGENPDVRARGLAVHGGGGLALVHSTSWRWEPDGRIVLTYLAWMKDVGKEARPLPALPPPAPTDPLHPRPAEIRELDPLAHGLRHLAFLLRTSEDGAVAAALGPRGVEAVRRFALDVAGELPER